MKNISKFIFIGGLIFLVGISFFVAKYHLTVDGAWRELENKEDGIIIGVNGKKDGTAFIIQSDGSISFAIAYHTDVIVLYKDFIIYPTNLNINNKPSQNEYHYSKVKGYGENYEMFLGLTTNPNVQYKYTIINNKETEVVKDNAQPIIDLEKYSNDALVKGVKLFKHEIDFIDGDKPDYDVKLLNTNLEELPLAKIKK